jgi:hypothetical protein
MKGDLTAFQKTKVSIVLNFPNIAEPPAPPDTLFPLAQIVMP